MDAAGGGGLHRRLYVRQRSDMSPVRISLRRPGINQRLPHCGGREQLSAAALQDTLNVQDRAGHDRRCARRTAENVSVSLADVAGIEGVAIAGRGNLLSPTLHIDARTVAR